MALRQKHLAPSAALDRSRLIRRVTSISPACRQRPPKSMPSSKTNRPPPTKRSSTACSPPRLRRALGRQWLDVVRYADTNGFELDADRPHAWRYRDYVIAAFNHDKPYDRFIREQIAGDEMFPGDHEALIATGYLRAGSEHLVSRQHRSRREPPGSAHRDRHHRRADLPGHDRQLRPLPQPQVRSDPAGAISTPASGLRRRQRQGRRDRHGRRKGRLGSRRQGLQSTPEAHRRRAQGARQALRRAAHAKSASASSTRSSSEASNIPKDKRTPEQKTPRRRTPKRRSSRPGTRSSRP